MGAWVGAQGACWESTRAIISYHIQQVGPPFPLLLNSGLWKNKIIGPRHHHNILQRRMKTCLAGNPVGRCKGHSKVLYRHCGVWCHFLPTTRHSQVKAGCGSSTGLCLGVVRGMGASATLWMGLENRQVNRGKELPSTSGMHFFGTPSPPLVRVAVHRTREPWDAPHLHLGAQT